MPIKNIVPPNLIVSPLGLSAPVAECDPGFYCPEGQHVPNPEDYPCPIGLHCPQGSPLPIPCEPGTYTNLTQMYECLECPAGLYCVPEEVIEGNVARKREGGEGVSDRRGEGCREKRDVEEGRGVLGMSSCCVPKEVIEGDMENFWLCSINRKFIKLTNIKAVFFTE